MQANNWKEEFNLKAKTVGQIMTKQVATVTLKDNIFEIAMKMKDHNVGFIPVVDGNKLIGCVTDRDLVIRGYAEKNSGSAPVKDVMTDDCVTCSPDTSVDEAAKIMAQKKIRRLLVTDNGELAGVVAIGDLAVRDALEQEAGQALSRISEPAEPVGV